MDHPFGRQPPQQVGVASQNLPRGMPIDTGVVGVDEIILVGHKGNGQAIGMPVEGVGRCQWKALHSKHRLIFNTHGRGDVEPAIDGIVGLLKRLHPVDLLCQPAAVSPVFGQFDDQQLACSSDARDQASTDIPGRADCCQSVG
jgi:hypothetical protein